jgi:hypothetical protein
MKNFVKSITLPTRSSIAKSLYRIMVAGLLISSPGCAFLNAIFNFSEVQHEAIDRTNPSSERTQFEASELHSDIDRIYN